jgi:hypothetical protein
MMGLANTENPHRQRGELPQKITKIVKTGLKFISYSFTIIAGLMFVTYYFMIMDLNAWLGSRIFFLPILMILVVPLVLIILGALNSFSMKHIYHQAIDEHWLSLLIGGIVVGFIGFILEVACLGFVTLFFGHQQPFFIGSIFVFYELGWPFILYYALYMPAVGLAMRETSILFFTKPHTSPSI